jgi:hypothetical protein
MLRTMVSVIALAVLALAASAGHAADVKIGINVGIPAPPVVVVAPPQVVLAPPPLVLAPPSLVIVAGTPVHHVPSASFNLFVYNGRYYSHHNGGWFVAAGPRAPWAAIAIERVPRPVLGVPVKHYKIPPGHAKKAGPHGGGFCPPGQAKKGRC